MFRRQKSPSTSYIEAACCNTFALSLTPIFLTGTPAHICHGSLIDFVTTPRAPITVPTAIDTPGPTNPSVQSHTWSLIKIGEVTSWKFGELKS